MSIREKLMTIQTKLKAKKGQFNKFGGYNYRSLEDIYESVKPLLAETKTVLTINNELEAIADIVFRKSIAILMCVETGEYITAYTYTQEAIEKKGMSVEQCSGSTASYSDKYCLNKLFCIDDTKDADSTNTGDTKVESKFKKEEMPVKEVKKEAPKTEDKPVVNEIPKVEDKPKTQGFRRVKKDKEEDTGHAI